MLCLIELAVLQGLRYTSSPHIFFCLGKACALHGRKSELNLPARDVPLARHRFSLCHGRGSSGKGRWDTHLNSLSVFRVSHH